MPEVIQSDAIYRPNAERAQTSKRIWDERHPNNYRFIVGSSDPKDYVRSTVVMSIRPTYPVELLAERLSGRVVIEGVVNSSGDVIEVFVVRSTDRRFEAAAIEALTKWKFKPARYKDHATMDTVSLPVEFDVVH